MGAAKLAALLASFSASVAVCSAQSDPSNFDTVLYFPPTLGDVVDGLYNTQVNISDGADLYRVSGGSDVEVNVSGGTVQLICGPEGQTTNISSGEVSSAFEKQEIHITGGTLGLGEFLRFVGGGAYNIHGGSTDFVQGSRDGIVNLSGGTVDDISLGPGNNVKELDQGGATLNMTGGEVTGLVVVDSKSVANISGGSFGSDGRLGIGFGGTLALTFNELRIDGEELDLPLGVTTPLFPIDPELKEACSKDEGFCGFGGANELSGVWADGSSFEAFTMISVGPLSNIFVTRVPEPTSAILVFAAALVTPRRLSRVAA